MASSGIPCVRLDSGHEMPVIGYGTGGSAMALAHKRVREACLDAVESGYRHFNTAALYDTERPLGEALVEALRRGVVSSWDDFFVTSKLWCSDAAPDLVLPAIKKSLH